MKRFSFLLVLVLIALGCQNNETPQGTIDDLSPFARKFLGMKTAGSDALAMAGNRTLNMAFSGAMNSYVSITGATDPGVPADSSIVDPGPGGWTTCATVTETQNPDGSTMVVTDYGEGCEEGYGDWKYFMFGKNTITYRYTSTQSGSIFRYDYLNRYKAEHFGGRYWWDMDNDGSPDTTTWISDGTSSFSGESSYDTASQAYYGHYDYSDTSSYTYNNQSYSYKSVGESTYDNKKSTVTKNNYEYRNGPDYYSSLVLIPLVSDYSCYMGMEAALTARPFWLVYVSGRERVTYSQGGETGEFEIDYGNGECDSIITIYEKGKIIRIDLSNQIGILAKGG